MTRVMAITVAALMLLLSGCATMSQRQLQKAEQFDLAKNGIAFLSLGRLGASLMQVYHLEFRPVGSPQGEKFWAIPENEFHDKKGVINDGEAVLEVVGHELPPGEYEIYKVTAFEQRGMVSRTVSSKQPFSFRFRVVAGEAVYLGSFQFIEAYGKNMLGMKVRAGGEFAVSDAAARDAEKMRELRPEARSIPVRKNLPPPDQALPFMSLPTK